MFEYFQNDDILKVRGVVCHACDKSFSSTSHLKRHIRSLHLKQRYLCDGCDKTYSRKDDLLSHKRQRHPCEYTEWRCGPESIKFVDALRVIIIKIKTFVKNIEYNWRFYCLTKYGIFILVVCMKDCVWILSTGAEVGTELLCWRKMWWLPKQLHYFDYQLILSCR